MKDLKIPALHSDCKWKCLQTKLAGNIFDISPVCKDHVICFQPYFLRFLGRRTNSPCVKLWALFAFLTLRMVLSCIMRDEKATVRISSTQGLPFLRELGLPGEDSRPGLNPSCSSTAVTWQEEEESVRWLAFPSSIFKTMGLLWAVTVTAYQTLLS